ncbi:phosphotransferase [Sulfitobacter mediterraneus]|uniref:phosphotransferase n=1 Tax=Sulfitobacter mediterraneus TaxID=83219 RepID=UPI001939FEDA|nr:phosphotransferase [Sulfitobacter mediterraneus]MBM1558739.1 phosphotransferase [Sulfitobacter mediterraneus]MBM1569625.1 phosphotransferase [Sulfitobacter mediterraneus]MBM1573152.1 phosphotransferase [Sulfitobacter mediterraneus]MBM1577232.1 phosphotransferase [Sulfitobacter mediterraneus]MBM1580937.1 phosphotransferase [Sulfitobacter mediterraneus]
MTVSAELLARIAALPCFADPQNIETLGGGITNVNLTVEDQGRKFVVRLGDDILEHGVMRWNELSIARAAAQAGVSPAVYHSEQGVMVLDFVDAAPMSAEDLHDPALLVEVTKMVRTMHHDVEAQVTGPVLSFHVFHILRSYAAFLEANGSSHRSLLQELMSEADQLQAAVGKIDLVLGHNDLLPANILRGADRLWLIDWEYGGFNSPLFDLGGLATNAGLEPEAEALMLRSYFDADPDADLMHRYGAMKCASLLRETMWSMVSEITSTLDFDYASYSKENLSNYRQAYATQFPARGQS